MINQILLNGIISGCNYALIALGFAIIHRTTKILHFAHGAVYVIGAYLAYALTYVAGIKPVFGYPISVIFAAFIGIAIDRCAYYPLRKHGAQNLAFLLSSFGALVILQNLVQLIFGAQVLALKTGRVAEGRNILGAVITDNQIVAIVSSLSFFFLFWFFIQKSKLGKAIRAVSDDAMGATVVGINAEKINIAVFGLGSALAGAAGVIISLETNIEPTMGLNVILKGIIASIIGGIGSIPGALFGGIMLGLAENLGIMSIQSEWKDAIAFVILILFLFFRPSGVMGVKIEKEKI